MTVCDHHFSLKPLCHFYHSKALSHAAAAAAAAQAAIGAAHWIAFDIMAYVSVSVCTSDTTEREKRTYTHTL